MAENADGQEKTESATEERREQFRNKGDIAHSREISSVMVLCGALAFISLYATAGFKDMQLFLQAHFRDVAKVHLTEANAMGYLRLVWYQCLKLIVPIFIVTTVLASVSTLAQTRLNWSFEKLSPQWSRLNPWPGLQRIISVQALVELGKSLAKMLAVGFVSYLILASEWSNFPGLLNLQLTLSWLYWAKITRLLFWTVAILLLLIAAADYIYQFRSLENKMKMTKQEVKEEYKQRETDPLIKGRMRRMQREIANRKTIEASKKATVIITNPTHYAIAVRYELGMRAPVVIAKGVDLMALRMREVAGELNIPIVENKPLARTLYKIASLDQEIPETLYKAVSEVIRYVFKIKGVKIGPG